MEIDTDIPGVHVGCDEVGQGEGGFLATAGGGGRPGRRVGVPDGGGGRPVQGAGLHPGGQKGGGGQGCVPGGGEHMARRGTRKTIFSSSR